MRILLVEDDLDYINSYIAEVEKDYIVDVAYTASDGAYLSEVNDYDLIVVDSSLPDKESYSLCEDVRNADVNSPILLLSDKDDLPHRMRCLKDGANVCLPKSISPPELSAQIKAILRLRNKQGISKKAIAGTISIDFDLREITTSEGKIIDLRKKEYELLEYLLINRGRVVSKEELLDHIWEEGILVKSNSLEVHMRNLRAKIDKPFGTQIIKTLRGFGYKIER